MKKLVAVLAVALFTVSMNVTAQEKKAHGPEKKETTTKKEACHKGEADKKGCASGEKKACCAAKKA